VSNDDEQMSFTIIFENLIKGYL